MYKVIGLETGKTYFTGTRAECSRELKEMYPFVQGKAGKSKITQADVLPEATIKKG